MTVEPSCYANKLGECAGGISREHIMSAAILELIDQGEGVLTSGTSWLKLGEAKQLKPSALTAKILCRNHNSLLSELDQVATDLFQAIREAIGAAHTGHAPREKVSIDGPALQCWMLKFLCGQLASGQLMQRDGQKPSRSEIPVGWLQVLFGKEPAPHLGDHPKPATQDHLKTGHF